MHESCQSEPSQKIFWVTEAQKNTVNATAVFRVMLNIKMSQAADWQLTLHQFFYFAVSLVSSAHSLNFLAHVFHSCVVSQATECHVSRTLLVRDGMVGLNGTVLVYTHNVHIRQPVRIFFFKYAYRCNPYSAMKSVNFRKHSICL